MQRGRYTKAVVTTLIVALGMVAIPSPSFAQADAATQLRPAADPGVKPAPATVAVQKIRKSRRIAYQMARYEWLDKVAAANPQVLEAICERPGAARLLAKHRHIDAMADVDHYLCRRITRWKSATDVLVHNPKAAHVINLDPEGIYYAIDRDPHIGTLLASHVRFDEMLEFNPDLGRVMDQHMH